MGFSICRSRLIFLADKCLVATADSSYVDTIRVWNIAAEAYLTIPSNHSNDIDELVFESRNLTERGCFEAFFIRRTTQLSDYGHINCL